MKIPCEKWRMTSPGDWADAVLFGRIWICETISMKTYVDNKQ